MTVLAPQPKSELDNESFRQIASLAYEECGLTLVEEKRSMICSRLRHRLQELKLPDFKSYCALLKSDKASEERRHLISALTTNVSHFFRENHHFETLQDCLKARLPHLRSGGEMRIWSAGSSNGQEALSAAMTLLETAPEVAQLDVRILGTDIDSSVVAFARAGVYPERMMGGIPDPLKQKYFTPKSGLSGAQEWAASPALRQMIRFNELNLLSAWPMKRRFDVVFCRNVVIYFDLETQSKLWPRFRDKLNPGGLLFLGHSERIGEPEAFGFKPVGPTSYQIESHGAQDAEPA